MGYAVKNASLAIKDVDTERGTVSGYFNAFDNEDSDEDISVKGAFAKTIAENGPGSGNFRIKHLLDHDTTKAVTVLERLEEDSFGLRYDGKAGRHTLSRDFLLMCQDGFITEHSFGYDVIKAVPNPNSKSGYGRIITEYKLWEGSSLQCWGVNPNTPLIGAKSLSGAESASLLRKLTERLATLTKALKGAYSDDLCERLEIQAAQIDALCKSLITEQTPSLPAEEPAPVTPEVVEPNWTELATVFKSTFSSLN